MTPLGLNTTAVPEAAALFPLGAAASAAAAKPNDGATPASSAFGDLLAANFGQLETPANTVAGEKPAPMGVSVADTWFAALTIDFNALNAGLDAEDTVTASSAGASGTAASLVNPDELTCEPESDDDEDAAAALMALMVPVPVPIPVPVPVEPLPVALSAASVSGLTALTNLQSSYSVSVAENAQGQHVTAIQATSSDSSEIQPLTPALDMEQVRDIQAGAAGVAREQKASASSPQPAPVPAATTTVPVTAATSSVQVAANSEPIAADDISTTLATPAAETPAVRPSALRTAAARAPERQSEAAQLSELAAAAGQPVVEASSKGQVIDLTPAVQQNERPRETMAAKLAETFGPGHSSIAETLANAASAEMADAQSESETQDGGAQEAFALGVQENLAPVQARDGGAPGQVFAIGQSHAAAAPVAAPAAEMPHTPTFTNTPAPENVGRLIESMKVQFKEGIQEATVHLKPEHLGEVTISVRVERGAVSAVVHAETPGVQQWLEAQEEKLRQGLSDQGLHLERFYVHRDGSQQQREQPRQQTQSAQRYRQQRNDQSVRFEVIV